ncbi:hypothetical protein QQF64_007664 [Cirrhinus molitorella]|uniref:L1 transposable element RRM domain-containing protein n=1 Tax=Cirrhinus molitorella TaxID=172907 RepID=A0ABR3MBA2_9TELE
MPRTAKKTEKKDSSSTASVDSPEREEGETGGDFELNPAMAKAFQHMTETISKTIDAKLDPLAELVHIQSEQLENCKTRLDEAERRIASSEDLTERLQARVLKLESQVTSLTEHVDDLENRGRRKNIRIIGLPEGAEGSDTVSFLQKWIPEFLHLQTKGGYVKIERAHRTLAPRPGVKERPRPLVVRMHNFGDKQRILDASRKSSVNGSLLFGNAKISFYQDFSAAVLRKRREFDSVKHRLQEIGARYAMLYPAKLRVTIGNATRILDTPAAVSDFISEKDRHVRPAASVDSPTSNSLTGD